MTMHEPECVALKRRGARHVAELLAGKDRAQQLAFWRERTAALRANQIKSEETEERFEPA